MKGMPRIGDVAVGGCWDGSTSATVVEGKIKVICGETDLNYTQMAKTIVSTMGTPGMVIEGSPTVVDGNSVGYSKMGSPVGGGFYGSIINSSKSSFIEDLIGYKSASIIGSTTTSFTTSTTSTSTTFSTTSTLLQSTTTTSVSTSTTTSVSTSTTTSGTTTSTESVTTTTSTSTTTTWIYYDDFYWVEGEPYVAPVPSAGAWVEGEF